MELHGIKETKEVLVAANDIAFEIVNVVGLELPLTEKLSVLLKNCLANEKLMADVKLAFENCKEVPNEIKDISLVEGLELGAVEIGELVEHLSK